jgi:hypothetical protein
VFRSPITRLRSDAPAAKHLNRIASELSRQAPSYPGNGLGVVCGQFGRSVVVSSENLVMAKTQGSGISACDGTTLGSGDVQIVVAAVDTDGLATLHDVGSPFRAYSYATEEVAANTRIMLRRVGGIWLCDWEDCPPTS